MGRWGGRSSDKAGARDATPEQIEKIRRLYERPGTPGEKAAAAAALERAGVDPNKRDKFSRGDKVKVTMYNGKILYGEVVGMSGNNVVMNTKTKNGTMRTFYHYNEVSLA